MDNSNKILISGDYNVFHEGWNSAGVYMISGLYISQTFKLPIYIGSSINLSRRIEVGHIYYLNNNKHPDNPILQSSWNKHGQDKIVNSRLGKTHPSVQKKIRCIDTGEIFTSIRDACKRYGLLEQNVGGVCRGIKKTCGKLHWEYVNKKEVSSG